MNSSACFLALCVGFNLQFTSCMALSIIETGNWFPSFEFTHFWTMILATSFLKFSNLSSRSRSDTQSSPLFKISCIIYSSVRSPNTFKSLFLAISPLLTLVKILSIWRTSLMSVSCLLLQFIALFLQQASSNFFPPFLSRITATFVMRTQFTGFFMHLLILFIFIIK